MHSWNFRSQLAVGSPPS